MIVILLWIVAVIGVLAVGVVSYSWQQMKKIPGFSFQESLLYDTENKANAVITVGIIQDGTASYKVFGEDGKELPQQTHTYEIGSITKTVTAALINKAVIEGKINLSDTVDKFLDVANDHSYPTIEEVLTHTSGYKNFYFENNMFGNFLIGRNGFYGVTKEMVIRRVEKLNLPKEDYNFKYSNFGYSVLGMILEHVYGQEYTSIVNNFLHNELGLQETKISEQDGDLAKYWDWKQNDAYLSAGAITSNITDMLAYAQLQLEENKYFATCHDSLKKIDASTPQYNMLDIHADEIGMAWMIDRKNEIIWHSGSTGNYNSYLGFIPEKKLAVVVLSNLSPNYKIPATVLGIKALKELVD